jgi:formate hydrogenlyase subunit 6/NADH:ubiquinone oxidoreductase subunit I
MKIKVVDCTYPEGCLKCVNACPLYVLVLKPIGTKKMSDFVKKWDIRAIFEERCDGCMRCVEACPKHCIQVYF